MHMTAWQHYYLLCNQYSVCALTISFALMITHAMAGVDMAY